MKQKRGVLWQLFLSTAKISAFTFGGGYVIIPLMRKRFVEELKWIDEQEMLDLISVSQSAPGPIAVNASLMIGYRMCGAAGALITALGTVLPPFVIISVISYFYQQFRDNAYVSAVMRGMQAGVAAVICNAVADLGRSVIKSGGALSALLMAATFACVYFLKLNIVWVVLACGLIGYIAGLIRRRRGGASGGASGEGGSE